jgi:hypothetical protein
VLDLATLETRRLLDCPNGYTGNLADFTADPQAYGQVFIVDVPEWDALPDRAAVTKNKEV